MASNTKRNFGVYNPLRIIIEGVKWLMELQWVLGFASMLVPIGVLLIVTKATYPNLPDWLYTCGLVFGVIGLLFFLLNWGSAVKKDGERRKEGKEREILEEARYQGVLLAIAKLTEEIKKGKGAN